MNIPESISLSVDVLCRLTVCDRTLTCTDLSLHGDRDAARVSASLCVVEILPVAQQRQELHRIENTENTVHVWEENADKNSVSSRAVRCHILDTMTSVRTSDCGAE